MAGLKRNRNLNVEQLENRQMMAGIVTITIDNAAGEAFFVGDDLPNGMTITFQGGSGSNNTYRISSVNTGTAGDTGTRFRIGTGGTPQTTISSLAIPSSYDLIVQMRDGNDRLVYNQNAPASNVAINFRDATFDLGLGAIDALDATYLRVARDWKIYGGQDLLNVVPAQAPVITLGRGGPNFVGRDFGYMGGNGNDNFTMLATTITRNVGLPPAVTYDNNNLPTNAYWQNPLQAGRSMETREGNDQVTFINTPTGPVLVGHTATSAAASIFRLDTGAGNDAVASTGMTVNQMIWNLNDGDDTVFFQSTTVRYDSTVDGGAGYDIHTESNRAPVNNFTVLTGATTDPTPSPTVVEVTFSNFENGTPNPNPGGGGGGGGSGGGGGGGGGRWNYRNSGGVVPVNTSGSAGVGGLEETLLTYAGGSGSNAVIEASALIANGRLLINGTSANDLILVTSVIDGLVRVRLGNRILGIFSVEGGVAINGVDGDDFIYVAPSSATTLVAANPNSDNVSGGSNVLVYNSNTVYTTRNAADAIAASNPATLTAQDLALLELLYSTPAGGGPGDGDDDGNGGWR
ncbi:hypothetical protein ETAA8_11260 [Anatilimnocola aggregata]|uniref:Uncharacterized protein n=1 Tax=Anatilimnocola aggregata TaxID=2528021 RepID=A0A517Y748_9BACT|nr:hypothetical protein [Anatilimnocola aggregata]QDU26054.1 hypothetical protein ETAA8_11260 [Anatilimnocola aggregata]